MVIFPDKVHQDSRQKTNGAEVYFARERIDAFANSILVLVVAVLLVIPMYLLLHVTIGPETTHSNAICICILLISLLLFSACLSAFTSKKCRHGLQQKADKNVGARRHEVLGAAAACVPALPSTLRASALLLTNLRQLLCRTGSILGQQWPRAPRWICRRQLIGFPVCLFVNRDEVHDQRRN